MSRLALIAVCVLASGLAASAASAQIQGHSVAYKMATIDCNCVPSATKIATYNRLLTKLVTHKCRESKVRLADKLTRAQEILAHDGFGHYSYLKLMRNLDKAIPGHFRQKCGDILAAMIVLIEKG